MTFKTFFLFIYQWGEQRNCTREEMISFYDSEGNVPLHSAVHGGDIKAVELCLKSGAKISKQQHDLSTPVHLACAQVSSLIGGIKYFALGVCFITLSLLNLYDFIYFIFWGISTLIQKLKICYQKTDDIPTNICML